VEGNNQQEDSGMNDLKNQSIIAIKLTAENRLALKEGDWFEATHSFDSTGTYKGTFAITDAMILDFVRNFKNGTVRRWPDANGRFRLKLNFEHWASEFAGWIVDVKAEDKTLSTGQRVKSLWMKAQVTPDAIKANKVEGKEYTSIEYYGSDPVYVDDQTGQATANVLVGGALTSDPFCMELMPMALSTLTQKHEEREAQRAEQLRIENDLKNQKKEEQSKMKQIIAILGTKGIKLSAEASEEAIVEAITTLSKGRDEAVGELSTVKAELITVKGTLSTKETELKTIKDAQAAVLAKAREEKITALKVLAVTDIKLSKAEIEETDPAKQHVFVKQLSLEDLSFAEGTLALMSKKVAPTGKATDGTQLSGEEAIIASAKGLQIEAEKVGKKLSHAEAYEKAKAIAAKGGK
jgi:hypothetical protein